MRSSGSRVGVYCAAVYFTAKCWSGIPECATGLYILPGFRTGTPSTGPNGMVVAVEVVNTRCLPHTHDDGMAGMACTANIAVSTHQMLIYYKLMVLSTFVYASGI